MSNKFQLTNMNSEKNKISGMTVPPKQTKKHHEKVFL